MTIAPDPTIALVAYLAADADIVSLAGDRVHGAELPAESSKPVLPPTVVVQDAGGMGRAGNMLEYHQRVDVYAYAPTPAEAKRLQLACIGALTRLKRTVINGTILYSAVKETGPYPGRSPTSFWPFSFSVWSVQTNYQEVN